MNDFEKTLQHQKFQLTKFLAALGATASFLLIFLQNSNSLIEHVTALQATIFATIFALTNQQKMQRFGAAATVCSLFISIVVVIINHDHPSLADTFFYFPIVVATAVILLDKYWGLAFLIMSIIFDALIISNIIPNKQTYLDTTPDIFIDRTISIICIYAIFFYSEHSMVKALKSIRERDQQLGTQEKMAALGLFASGISHEINNPLTIAKGYLTQVQRWLVTIDAPAAMKNRLSRIELNIQRISDITQSLLLIGKGGLRTRAQSDQLTSLSEIFQQSINLVESKLKQSSIEISSDCPDNLSIKGTHAYIRIILRIILDNAIDALISAQQTNPQITLTAEQIEDDISICIEDNGPGIPKEIIHKIFDPLFTTKDHENGNGIGLALCSKICQSLEWELSVDSSPGQTQFKIKVYNPQLKQLVAS